MFTFLLAGETLTILDLSCLWRLGTDRIENTFSNNTSIVALRGYRSDRIANIIPVLLFTTIT
jgi:hypothetical protein